MPNWCENTLTVTGEEKEVQRFKNLAKPKDQKLDSKLSFESLYPIADKKHWYQWCIEHWGTKWDVEATLDEISADYLEYAFASAWSPPIEWLKKVSQVFPRLRFKLKYDEPGNGFFGVATAEQGDIEDKCLVYS
jgi:Ferredoxin-like domain in Api92-like protein